MKKGLLIFGIGIIVINVILSSLIFLHLTRKPEETPKTVSFSFPPNGQHHVGEIFPLAIGINGIATPVNAIQVDLKFDPETIEVANISFENSIANIFIQKEINNSAGIIHLTGGLPNPGFSGKKGLFATVYFQAKSTGKTQITFLPSSMVLANDGKGTNVLKEFTNASYVILPAKTSSSPQETVSGVNTEKTELMLYDTDVVYK